MPNKKLLQTIRALSGNWNGLQSDFLGFEASNLAPSASTNYSSFQALIAAIRVSENTRLLYPASLPQTKEPQMPIFNVHLSVVYFKGSGGGNVQ
jgi:hypothetical protein